MAVVFKAFEFRAYCAMKSLQKIIKNNFTTRDIKNCLKE